MPAPKDLADDLCAAIDRLAVMQSRAIAWAEQSCPFRTGDVKYVGGRMTEVTDVMCRLIRQDDADPELIWVVKLIGTDGVEFTMSERAMPTADDLQN